MKRRLADAMSEEMDVFASRHRRSQELALEARQHLVSGVPMPWMTRWAGSFPLFIAEAQGGRFVDVDGHEYVDFCLGDTGSMVGHSTTAVTDALVSQSRIGLTSMLPSSDALVVAENLTELGLVRGSSYGNNVVGILGWTASGGGINTYANWGVGVKAGVPAPTADRPLTLVCMGNIATYAVLSSLRD